MRLTTRSRFALTAMTDVAMRCPSGPVTLSSISARHGISLSYLEALFSALRNAGLIVSARGPGGDAAGAGQRAGHLQKNAGEHHDRVEHLQNIAQKGGQLADRHPVGQNKIAAVPHDADNGRVHKCLESGQAEHGLPEGVGAGGGQLVIDGFKLLILVIAAHKRFDGADGG